DAVFDAVRGALYASRAVERSYLRKLSRLYGLLFTLNTEPRLIEYFHEMTSDYYLYVGSDQLVRALAEQYLPGPDQATRNTLLAASQAGATLVLTESTLDEVVWNLRTSDFEFRNTFGGYGTDVAFELARHSPKILVRAYLYARLRDRPGERKPKDWSAFVQQFCNYRDLHRPAAFDSMRRYLQGTFGMQFVTNEALGKFVDKSQFERLSEAVGQEKDERLARNDAFVALAVYGRRDSEGESGEATEFGYRTWWLTSETRILKHTRDLVADHRGARFIMRPDFLLNFLTLAPSAAEAREAFSDVFPSQVGLSLGRQMPEEAFQGVLTKVNEAMELDDARRASEMAALADRLRADFGKQYLIPTSIDAEVP
ncbi:MAG TPA: hypothetical protein VMM13_00225, partial [Euzebya sp.]|nr:hypothetical protein [Euzebya sp.]